MGVRTQEVENRGSLISVPLALREFFCLSITKARAESNLQIFICTLKTLTSLNKEVRPFFLSDNSIWSFPSVSSQRLQHLEVLKAI